jgi:FtsP/CotA-like multicopper oxidase with cupredoxin domain
MRPSLTRLLAVALAFVSISAPLSAQADAERERPPEREFLFPASVESALPRVEANDNTEAAGTLRNGVREISFEVLRSDWRVETPHSPGLRVAAVAETGGAPMIPAPLIRVEEGTLLRVGVRNGLDDESVTVFGLHTRPSDEQSSFELAPGESRTVEFLAGAPGTYLYRIQEGTPPPELPNGFPFQEREQLAGAFVVDPEGGSPPDRIMVINIFGQSVVDEDSDGGYLEGLTINGRSWPYTERMGMSVGQKQRWRVVNASKRFHPMHLHGFFYSVLSRGAWSPNPCGARPPCSWSGRRHAKDDGCSTAISPSMSGRKSGFRALRRRTRSTLTVTWRGWSWASKWRRVPRIWCQRARPRSWTCTPRNMERRRDTGTALPPTPPRGLTA